MNKNFVKKMLQAKQLEYEAIKEVMPEQIRNRIEDIEANAKELLKEVVFDIFLQTGKSSSKETSDKEKRSNKVNVDFEE